MGLVDNIKREAQGNKTKIQSTDAAALEKIFNAMFYLDKNIEEETKFVKQVMTRGLESQERVGLHASAMLVGEKDFCLRAQVLSLIYKQLQGQQTPVGLMRIFEQGNAIHEKWQRLLIRAGYGKAKDMDYTRFCDDYMLSYTPDIDCLIPEFFEGRMIGEIKSVNTYQFQKMTHHPSACVSKKQRNLASGMVKIIPKALYFLRTKILRTSNLRCMTTTQLRLSLLLVEQNLSCSIMTECLKNIRWLVGQRMQTVLHANVVKNALCVKLVGI